MEAIKEITSLSPDDCFLVTKRARLGFTHSMHLHPEFELNYLENAEGALRHVEDSVEEIDEVDLVLIAGGVKHSYANHHCVFESVNEITIQFQRNLFDSLIHKKNMHSVKNLFENASHGIVFSHSTIRLVQPLIQRLADSKPGTMYHLITFLDILHLLSLDDAARRLNIAGNTPAHATRDIDRLDHIMKYLYENFHKAITLADISSLISMSEASLNRFLKKWTGKTFIENLIDIRITEATGRLLETSDTISEVCYKSGFNNLSHFNRLFKKHKGVTPTFFRDQHLHKKILK